MFDFNRVLDDVRYKILVGHLCDFCGSALDADGLSHLKEPIRKVLSKDWYGSRSEPRSVSSTMAKLGHDLFITKGLTPSPWETIRMTLAQEGVKQIITIIGTIAVAAILVYLGLKAR
jgi:hypothetical protein